MPLLDTKINFEQDNPSLDVFLQMFVDVRVVPRSYLETRRSLDGLLEKPNPDNPKKPLKLQIFLVEEFRIDEARVIFPNNAIVNLRNPVFLKSHREVIDSTGETPQVTILKDDE